MIAGFLLIVIASLIPLRMLSLSEIELSHMHQHKASLFSQHQPVGLNSSLSEDYFGHESPALKSLLVPYKSEQFTERFPKIIQEVESWKKWQEVRRANMLFPVSDARGMPTLALLKLTTLLYAERRFTGTFSSELLEAREKAPEKKFGKLEPMFLSLLVLSSKYTYMELCDVLRSVDSFATLNDCAGVLQRLPGKQEDLLMFHRATPASLMPRLYERIRDRGFVEWQDGLSLLKNNDETYLYWLADGRSIRKDWQTQWWSFGAQYLPIHKLGALGKGGVVVTFVLMVVGVIMIFWSWIPTNRSSLGLRIGSSLLLCLLLGLSLEWMPKGVGQDLSLNLASPQKEPPPPVLQPPVEEPEIMTKELPIEAIQLMLVFLGIQILIFIWSCIQINRISKREGGKDLKMQLLENEDMLFDMGLYIGLGGTVLSLIFMVLGQENQGLIAAYTSTLFGILEVAIFKIFILRPFKQKLIVGV
jgi:hypothetical protein